MFPAIGVDGAVHEQAGLVHVPYRSAPATGFPIVVYGHMTTGGGPRSAPSTADPTHPEWRRMSQGDVLCDALLAQGIAVLRPDYEGIGGPGIHPYLIGPSLAESMIAMVRARADFAASLGDTWLAAGHSEGAVGALWASVSPEPDEHSLLVGTSAFAPVTRMDLSVGAALRVPITAPGSGVLSALIGLMVRGAAAVDAELAGLCASDGLSPRARAVWPSLAALSLTELSHRSSWGGIAPAALLGSTGGELRARLLASFRQNEVAALRGFRAPVRVDAATFDEVAPAPLTGALLRDYRRAGVDLTWRWWPTHHSGTMHARFAPSRAAAWIAQRLALAGR
ncbi:lipase family protein [Microbacterium sp. Clip185]|uniref:lipase family protein n=1 Tax=Microbacterium sp. Clip185 TaxID=3025663 RepID=UPI002365C29C|nr:lipase family protein [Microbacterium sp. Clip185]WDG18750.1 lipase family protein [Microbacterium sp. Clip185]